MEELIKKNAKINWQIINPQVMLIDENGKSLGLVETKTAIFNAKERNLDVMLVAENADPPVAKLIDFGKYKYKMEKLNKSQKSKDHSNEIKEMQLRMKINDHDLSIKLEKVRQFLQKRYKVKITLKMMGREMQFMNLAFGKIQKIIESLSQIGKVETQAKREGNRISVLINPK
jgi:translation initiation factor IF-3